MKHPTREEWMAFMYEELAPGEKGPMADHLAGCPECGGNVERWRGAMGALDAWKLPAKRARGGIGWVKWAAAAALFLAMGIGIGEVSARRSLRAESEKTREAISDLAQAVADNRGRDQAALLGTLRELEARRAGEMKALREDLETVAANTQAQLGRLVGFAGQ